MSSLYRIASNFDCPSDFLGASSFCRYVCEDGRTFPLRHQLAWCRNCNFVTSAEKLSTEREILGQMIHTALGTVTDVQVESIIDDPQKLERVLRPRSRQENAQALSHEWDLLELEMLRKRRSLPRCLTCGSIELLPPVASTDCQEEIEFQLGDGRWVKLQWSGIAEDCIDPLPTYSLEGLRVEKP